MSKRTEPGAMPGNIFLIGLMGAGKTSVGRFLAKRLNKAFYDCDQEIERRTGVKIPVIFEIEGEPGFRTRETAILGELVKMHDIVLATGGGAVLAEGNRQILRRNGMVVYLRATVDELWRRTRYDRNRPLLQTADARTTLQQLLEQRDPLYRQTAHIVVETGSQSLAALGRALERRLQDHFHDTPSTVPSAHVKNAARH
ncbi:MAG TPA: shikimate kinase [Burkholderiales bacterium]|nr:shikimate kinase [Burkholderiales bacterium]